MTTEETLDYLTTEKTLGYLDDISTTTREIFYPRNNCSVYNPCGRNGYCRDNLYDEWTCVCKFWWNGTLCNEMTDSGKQVIALGVLLGILLAIFYGLILFRSINKKRKLPKSDLEQNIPTIKKRIFPTIPITAIHPSHRILSWITGILTLLLTTATLLAKWAIIKPIHDEIVDNLNNNRSLFFKRHSICRIMELKSDFNLFTFPVACLLILLFIIITKRVSFQRNKWFKGYIGIPIPLDYFAHVKRTLAAVIFAISADELLDIVNETISGNHPSINKGIIVSYIMQILRIFTIGFRRYPILAAAYINNYFSLICATLYIWLDYSITIVHSGLCRSDFYMSDDKYDNTSDKTFRSLAYFGRGSTIIFLQLFTDIPRYLCLAYISIKLPMLLIKHIRQRKLRDRRLTREQKNLLYSSLPYSAESQYVKRLLGIRNTETSTSRFATIFRCIYVWRDDFRFSSRVICVYTSIFLLLFFLTVETCVNFLPLLDKAHTFCQGMVNALSSTFDRPDPSLQELEDPSVDYPLPDFVRPFLFAVFIALSITVGQLLVMLAGIRRNLLQAFRGDDCEIPRRTASRHVSYCTGNFHFGGYLIGYVTLAYVILVVIALLITMTIDAFITYRSVKLIETGLTKIIPLALFLFFKLYLNKFLGKYVFLQHAGDVLFINNRRAYMVFIYFNFFLDAFLGLLAAIIRILKSIFGGLLYMCRLDYSPLGRKLETMDAGFNAYCGLIHMECTHRHPVLLCFVSHLLRDHLYPTKAKRLSKAKHKWQVAVFLLNNPALIYRRKGFLTRVQENAITRMLLGVNNDKEMYIEQPPILAHRASIISEKELDELWERRRF